MKEIIFGMAVGGILGILLYKNNSSAKNIFDKSEKMFMEELEKYDTSSKPQSNKSTKK